MSRKFRYELQTINDGPFKMYRIVDTKHNPPRVLFTTDDDGEAHKYIQEIVNN